MDYPQHLLITRAPGASSQGSLNKQSGVWLVPDNPSADQVIYDGRADVQDPGAVLSRDEAGLPRVTSTSDITAFLKVEAHVRNIVAGDTAIVTWEDGSQEVLTVIRVHFLDGMLKLRGANARG